MSSITRKVILSLFLFAGSPIAGLGMLYGGMKVAEMRLEKLDAKDQVAMKAALASYDNATNEFKNGNYYVSRIQLEKTIVLLKSLRRTADINLIDNFINLLEAVIDAQINIDN